jgi:hypothetical protein
MYLPLDQSSSKRTPPIRPTWMDLKTISLVGKSTFRYASSCSMCFKLYFAGDTTSTFDLTAVSIIIPIELQAWLRATLFHLKTTFWTIFGTSGLEFFNVQQFYLGLLQLFIVYLLTSSSSVIITHPRPPPPIPTHPYPSRLISYTNCVQKITPRQ